MPTISVIGSGISGLSAACYVAQQGNRVIVYEKNSTPGGRARQYTEQGFTYDMGPSWYWMPDVFERFFNDFGKTTASYYELVKLDPGFRIFFSDNDRIDVPADEQALYSLFDDMEPGSSRQLKKYLDDAAIKYHEGMMKMAYKPCISPGEFADPQLWLTMSRLAMFTPMSKHVARYFKDLRLRALMEFPVLFLGAMASKVPALYSLMNFTALRQGTWYPMGGMYKIVEAMQCLALSLGVEFRLGTSVTEIETVPRKVNRLMVNGEAHQTDAIIATGDYRHMEQLLAGSAMRNYNESYWNSRTFAPSCLIFYLGFSKRIPNLLHHNLFFDADMDRHAKEIYERPSWPTEPLFYACCPSKTDPTVAPDGCENLFLLMPVATGLSDSPLLQEEYYRLLMRRLEKHCGISLSENVIYKKTYSVQDFSNDYHAYRGNAYGLANTLMQTALLKPKLINKKIKNLFYAGQLTVPGPGVPPSLISGKLAAGLAVKFLKRKQHERGI